MKQWPIVILLGAAGSGKGTQAALLQQRYGFEKIEAGAIVREKAKEDSPLGRELKKISDSGAHSPDTMISELLKDHVKKIPLDRPLVVDGYPRTIGQADLFAEMLKDAQRASQPLNVVWINVGLAEAKRRLLNRGVCQKCHAVYPVREQTPCAKCGGTVIARVDDTEEGIAKRLAFFVKETMAMIERYRAEGVLIEVNGEQPMEMVSDDIAKAVGLL
jgi:adenylate kinase